MNSKKFFAALVSVVLTLCLLIPLAACNNGVEVTAVELDRATLTLDIGAEATLNYVVLPTEAAGLQASWLSSDTNVVTVNDGKVKGIAEGTAAVRVSVGGKFAICQVTVTDPSKAHVATTGITLNYSSLKLSVEQTTLLTATVQPENATNKSVTWRSSMTNVATVDGAGLVTAVGTGTTVITARTADGFSASCVVQVESNGQGGNNSKSLYVGKIGSLSNRTQPFIMGMDASAVPSLENAGVTYKNFDGEVEDVFAILKDNGITDIRIRVWNDPYDAQGNSYGGGNCDIDNAVAIAKRCQQVGLGVIIDFHYSDFWADPGKQTIPKEWRNYSVSQVAEAIYQFTKDSLQQIKNTGVKITMVQVGNETTSGIAGTTDWSKNASTICNYINNGSKAVREVTGAVADGGARVAVHFTNPEGGTYLGFAKYLNTYQVDYDVFGSSYYPYWHGTLSNLASQLKSIYNTYGKEAMVLETSYAFTMEDADGCGNTALTTTTQPVTVQGQSNAVRQVIETIAELGDYGLGVCYWEGTWIAASTSQSGAENRALCKEYGCGWASSYAKGYDRDANDGGCVVDNQAFFLSDGTPLESLKVFKLVYEGQTGNITADYLYDQEAYYTVNEGTIELPDSVRVILNNGSDITVAAYWVYTEEMLAEYMSKVGTYVIEGTTDYGGTCNFIVWVQNKNLLSDGSFEDATSYGPTDNFIQRDGLGNWEVSYSGGTSALQLYVSNESQNARMGSNSFHFWDSGVVNFKLYQKLDMSKLADYGDGMYGCSFEIQGNDGANVNVYAYVTLTYSDGTTQTFNGSKVDLTGWQVWNRTEVSNVAIDSTVTAIEVGISVYAEVSGNGPWGNIDNAQFFFAN